MRHHALIAIAALSGCVDGFKGSNVQFDFAPGTPVEASPGATVKPSQLPANVHLTLYAVDETSAQSSLFAVQTFEIHRIVDLDSPCYIDVGPHVPHPGLHVSQFAAQIAMDNRYTVTGGVVDIADPPAGATTDEMIDVATAVQRQNNVRLLSSDMGMAVISGASSVTYPAMDADCSGSGIPPTTCVDEASNARRLAKCQAIWATDSEFFEGTDRVLTVPLNGVTHGMVDGTNPVNQGPVGGAQFFVDTNLADFTTYAIYSEVDATTGTGTLLYYGHTLPTSTRGVIHATLLGVINPKLKVELAIFADLGDDDVQF